MNIPIYIYIFIFIYLYIYIYLYLYIYLYIYIYIWNNKNCSKPPTSYWIDHATIYPIISTCNHCNPFGEKTADSRLIFGRVCGHKWLTGAFKAPNSSNHFPTDSIAMIFSIHQRKKNTPTITSAITQTISDSFPMQFNNPKSPKIISGLKIRFLFLKNSPGQKVLWGSKQSLTGKDEGNIKMLYARLLQKKTTRRNNAADCSPAWNSVGFGQTSAP